MTDFRDPLWDSGHLRLERAEARRLMEEARELHEEIVRVLPIDDRPVVGGLSRLEQERVALTLQKERLEAAKNEKLLEDYVGEPL